MEVPGFVTVPRSFIPITVCVDADWALASIDVREAHLHFPFDKDESGDVEESYSTNDEETAETEEETCSEGSLAEDDLTVDVARLMAPDVKTEPDGKQGKPIGHESIQVAEEIHLKPEAKQCLRKRAGSTLADVRHDGKS